jgi:hypothetical protein
MAVKDDIQSQIAAQKELSSEIKSRMALEQELARIQGDATGNMENTRQTLIQVNSQLAERIQLMQEIFDSAGASAQQELKYYENLIKNQKELTTEQKDRQQLLEELSNIATSGSEKQKKGLIDQTKQQVRANASVVAASAASQQLTEDFAGLIGITNDWQNTTLGGFYMAIKEADNLAEGLFNVGKAMGNAMMEVFHPMNLLTSGLDAIIQWYLKVDQMSADLGASMGLAKTEVSSMMYSAQSGAASMGVSIEDAGKAIEGLYTNYSAFSQLDKGTQVSLARTTAVLGELGISADDVASNMDDLTKGLGYSVGESIELQKELAEEAVALGVTPATFADNLKKMMPKLAAFGRRGPKIFKDLQREAKRTGLEMDKLMGITEGLDEFDTAADAVTSLNTVLRGPFADSMDLVMAASKGPAAQIDYLRGAFERSGKSFNDLDFWEQKEVASALGQEVTDLAKAFGGNTEEITKNSNKQKSAEAIAASTISSQEKLQLAMENMMPPITQMQQGIDSLLNKFMAISEKVREFWIELNAASDKGQFLKDKLTELTGISWAEFEKGLEIVKYIGIAMAGIIAAGWLVSIGQGIMGIGIAIKNMGLLAIANPITALLILIAGLVVYAIMNWEDLVDTYTYGIQELGRLFRGWWNDLKKLWSDGVQYITDLWNSTVDGIANLWKEYVTDPLNESWAIIKQTWAALTNDISALWKEYVSDPIDNSISWIQDKWSGMTKFMGDLWDDFASIFTVDFWADLFEGMGKSFRGIWDEMLAWLHDALNFTMPSFSIAGEKFGGYEVSLAPDSWARRMGGPLSGFNLVGEGGPEIVAGGQVTPAGKSQGIIREITEIHGAVTRGGGDTDAQAAIQEMRDSQKEMVKILKDIHTAASQKDGKPISIHLDGKKVGKSVDNYLQKEYSLSGI